MRMELLLMLGVGALTALIGAVALGVRHQRRAGTVRAVLTPLQGWRGRITGGDEGVGRGQ